MILKKKGQLLSQVFVFMLAAVTLVMILLFGYKYIDSFMEQQEKVEMINFRDTLLDGVNSIRTRYGSIDKLTLQIPSRYGELCFVDSDSSGNLVQDRPLLHNLWSSDKNQTVFLIPLSELNIKVENVQVENGYFCTPTETKMDLKLESLGKKVKISLWE
jgi:hypothetical protein